MTQVTDTSAQETVRPAGLTEGHLLRANDWAQKGLWTVFAVMMIFSLMSFGGALGTDDPDALPAAIAYLLFALLLARFAVMGLVVEGDSLRVRTFWRTRHLSWLDIKSFELRGTVFRPSLQIKLVSGKTIGAAGLEVRSSEEEKRVQRIYNELCTRLAREKTAIAES